MFPTDMSRLDKCMVLIHAEGDISHIAVEELLRDTQPLRCVYQTIIPFINDVVLKATFSKSSLDCYGSNIFAMRPLSGIVDYLPIGGFHLNFVNATSRYP
jgi:hypothetical protein